jgi:phenylpyruvate tautomerase PptA (4-oxalocrotonate tautomerase family)
MPLYTVSSHQALNEQQKQKLVNGITDIHCDITQAPAMFVQVVFSFNVPLEKSKRVHMLGSIRHGRSDDIKEKLMDEFRALFSEVLAVEKRSAEVVLIDIPASWVIEGGEILPEPGEEDAWMARLNLN